MDRILRKLFLVGEVIKRATTFYAECTNVFRNPHTLHIDRTLNADINTEISESTYYYESPAF